MPFEITVLILVHPKIVSYFCFSWSSSTNVAFLMKIWQPSEALVQMYSIKKLFLKILKYSQENISVEVSFNMSTFLIYVFIYKKRCQVASRKINSPLKNSSTMKPFIKINLRNYDSSKFPCFFIWKWWEWRDTSWSNLSYISNWN